MRAVLLLFVAGLAIVPNALLGTPRSSGPWVDNTGGRGVLSSTQTLSFDPAGVIQVERSYGDIEIQGWDRPEVEITTIKAAKADDAQSGADNDQVEVTAVKQGEDRLTITTDFPVRKKIGSALHGRAQGDLKYLIKAPAQARLVVHHDMGQVNVSNFTGDIEVTNRVGEIGLELANPKAYRVDARARVGEVDSEVGCRTGQNLTGQRVRRDGVTGPQLYLRVGVGDITIRKIRW